MSPISKFDPPSPSDAAILHAVITCKHADACEPADTSPVEDSSAADVLHLAIEAEEIIEELYGNVGVRIQVLKYATCRNCQQEFEVDYDVQLDAEIDHYCNRSDRCIP